MSDSVSRSERELATFVAELTLSDVSERVRNYAGLGVYRFGFIGAVMRFLKFPLSLASLFVIYLLISCVFVIYYPTICE